MKLKIDSWHAKFYLKSYGGHYLPEILSVYFWQLVLAIVLLPITWWTYYFKQLRYETLLEKTLFSVFWYLVATTSGFMLSDFMDIQWYTLPLCTALGTVFIVCFITFLWGLLKITSKIKSLPFTYKIKPSKTLIKQSLKDFKEKTCTKIDWENGE